MSTIRGSDQNNPRVKVVAVRANLLPALAGLLLLAGTTGLARATSCEVTYQNVLDGYAALGVGEVGSYQNVGSGADDPKRRAILREGMYVASYDSVHVFGTADFISYVFALGGCVVAEVRWSKGDELEGMPT